MADLINSPFARVGDRTSLPVTDSTGKVNWDNGYTPNYEIDLASGDPLAKAVERDKMNYLFWILTDNVMQYQKYGYPEWTNLQTGGYARGACVTRTISGVSQQYKSLSANNTSDPNSSAAQWTKIFASDEVLKSISAPFGGSQGYAAGNVAVGVDFNASNLLDGTFYITSDTAAQACTNAPAGNLFPNGALVAGVLISLRSGPNSAIQIYKTRLGYVCSRCAYNSAGWTAWTRSLNIGDFGLGTTSGVNAGSDNVANWPKPVDTRFSYYFPPAATFRVGISVFGSSTHWGQWLGPTQGGNGAYLQYRNADNLFTIYSDRNKPTSADTGSVPVTRKINGYTLDADRTLTYADVGAVPTSRTVNGLALTGNIVIDSVDIFKNRASALATVDLDTMGTSPGLYYQNANANATAASHYPPTNIAGGLINLAHNASRSNTSGMIYQEYTTGDLWTRSYDGAAYSKWQPSNQYPVGAPIPWPQASIPVGFTPMSGQTFDKVRYPLLAIAYPAGVLNDMRGQIIKGTPTGRANLSLEGPAIQSHSHTASAAAFDYGTKTSSSYDYAAGTTASTNLGSPATNSAGAHTHTLSGTAASAGNHHHNQRAWRDGGGSNGRYIDRNTFQKNGYEDLSSTTTDAGAHTHTISGTAASAGAHTHTTALGGHTHGFDIGAHTHTVGIGSHGHTITVAAAGSATTLVQNIAFTYIVRMA